MKNKSGIPLIVSVVVFVITFYTAFVYGTKDSVDIVVTKTERVSYGNSEDLKHKYLIYTEDETFENSDTIFYMKFNSSDLHGKLKQGGEYRIDVYGWRIPIMSTYRNVVKVSE